jgi:hypothetical protein
MPPTFSVVANASEPVSVYLQQQPSQISLAKSRASSATVPNQSYAHAMASNSSNPGAAFVNRSGPG